MGESSFERMRDSAFSESEKLLAQIVETGGSMDPQKLASTRAQLQQQLKILGVVQENGQINIQSWMDYVVDISTRKSVPMKPDNYPSEEIFLEGFKAVHESEPELFDDIAPRGEKTMEEYF